MKTLLLAFLLTGFALAAERTLLLTPENTRLEWTLADPLHTVHGTFRLKSGELRYDTASGKADGQIVIDAASGESGNRTRDNRMHSLVLESARYPEARFTAQSLTGDFGGQGKGVLRGVLNIHGAAHDVLMDVTLEPSAEGRIAAAASFDLPYVAWGMKDPSNFLLKVGKTVRVTIRIDAAVQP